MHLIQVSLGITDVSVIQSRHSYPFFFICVDKLPVQGSPCINDTMLVSFSGTGFTWLKGRERGGVGVGETHPLWYLKLFTHFSHIDSMCSNYQMSAIVEWSAVCVRTLENFTNWCVQCTCKHETLGNRYTLFWLFVLLFLVGRGGGVILLRTSHCSNAVIVGVVLLQRSEMHSDWSSCMFYQLINHSVRRNWSQKIPFPATYTKFKLDIIFVKLCLLKSAFHPCLFYPVFVYIV